MRQYCVVTGFMSLEFASGYGCVTRHLIKEFVDARITACDIHDQALKFISEQLQLPIVRSSHNPEAFQTGRQFDAVFAISFFSHMPKTTWPLWLKALAQQVLQGGVLIFTTHGQASLLGAPGISLDDEGFLQRAERAKGSRHRC